MSWENPINKRAGKMKTISLDKRHIISCAIAFDEDGKHQIIEAICSLLRESPDLRAWANFAVGNQAITTLHRNALYARESGNKASKLDELIGMTKPFNKARMYKRSLRLAEFHKLRDVWESEAEELLAIKGLALGTLYPESYVRHFGDFDLFCATPDGMSRLAESLFACGYRIKTDEPPWIKKLRQSSCNSLALSSMYFGQCQLVREECRQRHRVDIHFTAYSISYSAIFPVNLFQNARSPANAPLYLSTPSPEDNLLILAAHIASSGFISVKDLNDLAVIMRQKELAWDYIADKAIAAGILDTLLALFDCSKTYMPHHAVKVPSDFQHRTLASKLIPTFEKSWFKRALLNAYCNFLYEQKHLSLRKAIWHVGECLAYYLPKLQVTTGKAAPIGARIFQHSLPKSPANLQQHVCMRLIPVETVIPNIASTIVDTAKLVHTNVLVEQIDESAIYFLYSPDFDQITICTINNHCCLPTLTYHFSKSTLKQAEAFLHKIQGNQEQNHAMLNLL
jgi:hypothetical protein